jgi:heme oxygenase (mycobilin-producing)
VKGSPSTDEPVTLINVIELPADEADAFVDGWRERADFMRRQPGFRSYRLHRAMMHDSRFQLINIAEWDSQQAFLTATADPEFQSRLQAITDSGLQVTGHPGLYRIALQAHAETRSEGHQ